MSSLNTRRTRGAQTNPLPRRSTRPAPGETPWAARGPTVSGRGQLPAMSESDGERLRAHLQPPARALLDIGVIGAGRFAVVPVVGLGGWFDFLERPAPSCNRRRAPRRSIQRSYTGIHTRRTHRGSTVPIPSPGPHPQPGPPIPPSPGPPQPGPHPPNRTKGRPPHPGFPCQPPLPCQLPPLLPCQLPPLLPCQPPPLPPPPPLQPPPRSTGATTPDPRMPGPPREPPPAGLRREWSPTSTPPARSSQPPRAFHVPPPWNPGPPSTRQAPISALTCSMHPVAHVRDSAHRKPSGRAGLVHSARPAVSRRREGAQSASVGALASSAPGRSPRRNHGPEPS